LTTVLTSIAKIFDPTLNPVEAFQSIFPGSIESSTVSRTSLDENFSPPRDALPSEQIQLPFENRIAKAIHDESSVWILSMLLPVAISLTIQSHVPFMCSVLPEVIFLAYCLAKLKTKLNYLTIQEPLLKDRNWEDVRNGIWEDSLDTDGKRAFVMGWFYDEPFERLRREDAVKFLSWIRFGTTLESLTPIEQHDVIYSDLPRLEKEVNNGVALPQRTSDEEALGCMRFNLEPIRFRPKPLLFYAITHGVHAYMHSLTSKLGFTYVKPTNSTSGLPYWHRPPKNCNKNSTPLIFFHGVGGVGFYSSLVEELSSTIDGHIFIVDLPFVSLRICDSIPKVKDQVQSIVQMLDNNVGVKTKATLVGHSYGSILQSWMVQSQPERVSNCVFIDPVCFNLHHKKSLFNFHMNRVDMKQNKDKLWKFDFPFSIDALINLAGTELHTNHLFFRHFWWATNALWPKDLAKNDISAAILLSELDDIVPSQEIEHSIYNFSQDAIQSKSHFWNEIISGINDSQKSSSFIRTEMIPGAKHGEILLNKEHRKKAITKILAMIRLSNIKSEKEIISRKQATHWNALSVIS